jgi:hypothetical protein
MEYSKPRLMGLAAVAVIGIAGPAGLVAGLRALSVRSVPSAAASVAARFPRGEIGSFQIPASDLVPVEIASARLAPSVFSPPLRREPWSAASDQRDGELFSPVAAYPVAAAAATRSAEPGTAPEGAPRDAARRRTAYRPKSVLNDAQIASIKERLNLTPEQEAMWPPVETALRQVSYLRNPADAPDRRAQQSSGRLAFIDPDSAEVRRLKYAALPLIMRLNDDQRREVNSMAHVMGLGKLASE